MMILQTSKFRQSPSWAQSIPEENKINSMTIEHYLGGLNFPANKQEIIRQGSMNGAPQNIMAFYTYRLLEKVYRDPAEVSFTAFASAYFFGQD
jgi:hypothetical protein